MGIHADKLWFFTPEGELILLPEEEMEQAEQRAIEAEQEIERLKAILKALRTTTNRGFKLKIFRVR